MFKDNFFYEKYQLHLSPSHGSILYPHKNSEWVKMRKTDRGTVFYFFICSFNGVKLGSKTWYEMEGRVQRTKIWITLHTLHFGLFFKVLISDFRHSFMCHLSNSKFGTNVQKLVVLFFTIFMLSGQVSNPSIKRFCCYQTAKEKVLGDFHSIKQLQNCHFPVTYISS